MNKLLKNSLNSLILVSLLNSPACFAAGDPTVAILRLGEAAPFTGLLFEPSYANDLRKTIIEFDGLTAINGSLNKSLVLQEDIITHERAKVTMLLEQNDKLAVQLQKSQSMNTWEKVAWLSLGMLAVGIGAYGVHKIQ